MRNVKIEVDGDLLIITVDLNERYGRSKSGKSVIIGTTEGIVSVPGNADVKVGVNVFTKE